MLVIFGVQMSVCGAPCYPGVRRNRASGLLPNPGTLRLVGTRLAYLFRTRPGCGALAGQEFHPNQKHLFRLASARITQAVLGELRSVGA